MNITRIKNHYSFYALLAVVTMSSYYLVQDVKMQRKIAGYKTEILKQDSSRYNRAVNMSNNTSNVFLKQQIWKREYMDMQDSLYKLNLDKEAYYESLRLLDSLNNTQ